MKRTICLITALCLIFSSFSFCFAQDWSSTDSQNLSNVASRLYYMNNSAAYYLYNIATNTQNLYNKTVDIYNALFYGNHNITYWVNSICTWMSPIYNSITSIPTDLSTIIGALGYYDSNNTYHPYLNNLDKSMTNYNLSDWSQSLNSHEQLFNPNSPNWYYVKYIWGSGNTGDKGINWRAGTPLGNIAAIMQSFTNNQADIYSFRWTADLTGYNSLQSLVSFANPRSTVTFTPLSATDGIYKYLNAINTPLARLGYILASDERIEAQEAAAANEEAVVDNFIDSSGNGSASPSDIGSISDLSSGYKSNFGSEASVSGIFNIFNSNNMGWFSQETANQLDTTIPTRRGSSFETPLLDQQIDDIYDQIGVKHD